MFTSFQNLVISSKFLFAFTLCLAVFSCSSISVVEDSIAEEWKAFKLKYSKEYTNETEDLRRMNIFKENKAKIAEHNEAYERRNVLFKMALNKYADLSGDELVWMNGQIIHNEEWKAMMDNIVVNKTIEDLIEFKAPINVKIPPSLDWREKGAVTEVREQGTNCGACWAIAMTGALEAQHFFKTGTLEPLSFQNLIDCTADYGSKACSGGSVIRAFQYVKDNGINSEKDYPYEGKNGTCKFDPMHSVTTQNGIYYVSGGEENFLSALVLVGPLIVAIDATQYSFRFYSSGVYYEPLCDNQNVGHAVLVVGFGTDESGQDYYIVKNSWGETWGQEGYVKMARNRDNNCHLSVYGIFPLV